MTKRRKPPTIKQYREVYLHFESEINLMLSQLYNRIRDSHGLCTCPKRGNYFQTPLHRTGTFDVELKNFVHLRHDPVNSDIIEDAFKELVTKLVALEKANAKQLGWR